MHPSATRSSRSSLQSSVPSPSASPSLLQQQQQHILYGPVTTLQSCTTPLHHPSCVYPPSRRGIGPTSPSPLQTQGKSNKWHANSRQPRGQYCQAQSAQQLSYATKPLVLFDQSQNNPPPSASSFLVASSTFAHGPFPTEHYGNTGVTLIPQPYFKPPDVPTFCLVQDRQTPQQHSSYYNISATNTCSLQTVNANSSYQLPNLAPYAVTAFSNNQISAPLSVQSTQVYPSPPIGLVFGGPARDKYSLATTLEDSSVKCSRNKVPVGNLKMQSVPRMENNEWPVLPPPPPPPPLPPPPANLPPVSTVTALSSSSGIFDVPRNDTSARISKIHKECHSDESSASFDFTIEAEKMVSALCNTTSSNDLGKDETRRTDAALLSGAGDNVPNKGTWFADLSAEYSIDGHGGCRSIATQTHDRFADQQLSELIRKAVYWGCTEAETILNSARCHQDPRHGWLSNLSSATRIAITKSSTCFPIFAGDRVFVDDLINALLRISNGWLILDNYLNKQHYPSLIAKYDPELARSFHCWESSTYELLRNVIRTYLKLEERNTSSDVVVEQTTSRHEVASGSFPGDVSLYTTCDLLDPLSSNPYHLLDSLIPNIPIGRTNRESPYTLNYSHQPSTMVQNFRYFGTQQNQKEAKLRSRWTITENLASTIDSTKSVPDMSLSHVETGPRASKFRSKGCSSSAKENASRQSLNAEFCHLRNKVMESNSDPTRQWATKERKQEFAFGTRTNSAVGEQSNFRMKATNASYESGCLGNECLPRMGSILGNSMLTVEPMYVGTTSSGIDSNYEVKPYSEVDYPGRTLKCTERQNYGSKSSPGIESVYMSRSATDQLELATIPRNRMTLLSQIEPNTSTSKEPEEMTANLSAWFASIRNATNPITLVNSADGRPIADTTRSSHPQEMSRSTMDLTRQLQMDANQQLQTLQNMQSIQSAPWNACNLINSRTNVQQQVEEYDSSEDVRVYMKPGSYNVPKKRHQRRPNRRVENSSASRNSIVEGGGGTMITRNLYSSNMGKPVSSPIPASSAQPSSGPAVKIPFPATPIVPPPTFSLENSPRILRRANSTSTSPQDVTWKAACASAEILLEALNVKDATAVAPTAEMSEAKLLSAQMPKRTNPKCENDGATSYEASEDDSGSTCKLSPGEIHQPREIKAGKVGKANVKTDSWLIRTLNNVSVKQRQEPDLESSVSSNSSTHEDGLTVIEKLDASPRESRDRGTVDLTEGITRATYSETVRRCATTSSVSGKKESYRSRQGKSNAGAAISSTVVAVPGRKCQRKDAGDKMYLMHKSRRSGGKKIAREAEDGQSEEGFFRSRVLKEDTIRSSGKKKDGGTFGTGFVGDGGGKNKSGDRGWSIWYSSRRKQGLSPLASSKLEAIHQALWQMDEALIFKCPPSGSTVAARSSGSGTFEDYCKMIKSPMFLETIGYKLKNRIYYKVEHAVRDFRRIVYNMRLYYKNDGDRMARIEILSKKLEELLEQQFASWDFENITGSPKDGDGSPVPPRYKLPWQKVSRYAKKSPSSSANARNVTLH